MNEWQLIETAPKDGSWILIWETGINDKFSPAEVARFTSRYWEDGSGDRLNKITHWMPLPAPPKAIG